MKKIVNIKPIALSMMLIALTSCSSDFLDTKPQSDYVSGSFKTAQDAENLLTGAYATLTSANDYFVYDRFYVTEGISDSHYVNGDNAGEQQLENFSFTTSNGIIEGSYRNNFTFIAAANATVDNVTEISDPKWQGTNRKEQILAEAKFIRALAYYELVTQFGGVPVMTSQLNGGNLTPARNTESEVYDQIIADLTDAETILNVTPYANQNGRATKGAAQALLAKVYAQKGDYANCLAAANKVINNGPYSLVPNFANLWRKANNNSTESIYEIQRDGTSGSWAFGIFGLTTDNFQKRNLCTPELINLFKAEDGVNGVRYTTSVEWGPGAPFLMPINAWPQTAMPYEGKYKADGWNNQDNIRIIRLADIVLLAAEANVQLVKAGTGGSLATATTLLNQIRNRSGLANTTATSQSQLAMAILNERRLELVFECTRWNDLKRADANGDINIVDVMNNQRNSSGQALGYTMGADKHHIIYPIPNKDRLLNKNLTQNPGYPN